MLFVSWPPFWHSLFEWLGYGVGGYCFSKLKKQDILEPAQRAWVVSGAIIGAWMGSKLIVWLDDPSWFFYNFDLLPGMRAKQN